MVSNFKSQMVQSRENPTDGHSLENFQRRPTYCVASPGPYVLFLIATVSTTESHSGKSGPKNYVILASFSLSIIHVSLTLVLNEG